MLSHYAVIGNPVLHSLSPLIHQRAFDFYQIPARYFAYQTENFSEFMEYFLSGKGDFQPYSYMGSQKDLYAPEQSLIPYSEKAFSFPMQGLSVTIPHKKSVLESVRNLSYKVRLSGAANTLYWKDGELCAENTDIAGFFAPVEQYVKSNAPFCSATVYGAGGAACAVLVALLHLAELKDIYVCARREEQAQELISHFQAQKKLMAEQGLNTLCNLHYLPLMHEEFPCDLAVNTIPQWGSDAVSPRENFDGVKFAYDLTYKKTPFLAKAESRCHIQDGTVMFKEQAKAQFFLWTGLEIPEQCWQGIF